VQVAYLAGVNIQWDADLHRHDLIFFKLASIKYLGLFIIHLDANTHALKRCNKSNIN